MNGADAGKAPPWWLDPAIARLAFGSGGSHGTDDALAAVEHLRLDLADPQQRTLGEYELLELIGEGGMGLVYRAKQTRLQREVAVKLLSAGPWAPPDFIARFQEEARHAARLRHPGIVTVYGMGEHDGLVYYAMELVRGQSLAGLLRQRESRLPGREAARLVRTIAEAVAYAHSLGVLHLDLKPGNILLDEDGQPRVADFGLARRIGRAGSLANERVAGTPSYMAPEQAGSSDCGLSRATDVWGLGAILYELLCAHPPFEAADAATTLQLLQGATVRRPSRLTQVSPDLEAVCLACLARSPVARYQDARALADDLGRFLDGRPVGVRPLNGWQRIAHWARREPLLATATAASVLALLGGIAATSTQWRRAEHGAAQVRVALWAQRDDAALRAFQESRPFAALPLLARNLAEQEAAGEDTAASVGRRRIGITTANSPALIAAWRLPSGIASVALDPAGETAVVGTFDGMLRRIDRRTGQELWRHELPPSSPGLTSPLATELSFTSDGRRVVVGRPGPEPVPVPFGKDSMLIELDSGRALVPPASSFPEFRDAAFDPDGEYALLTNQRLSVRLLRVNGWQPASDWQHRTGRGQAPRLLAPHARHVARLNVATQALDLFDGEALRPIWSGQIDGRVGPWRFDASGRWLALGLRDGRVLLLDCERPGLQTLSPSPAARVRALAFSGDGAVLHAVAEDGNSLRWRVADGVLVGHATREAGPLSSLALDPGGRWSASLGRDRGGRFARLSAWTASTTADTEAIPLVRLESIEDVSDLQLQPLSLDARNGLMALATENGTLSFWRLPLPSLREARAPPQGTEQLGFDGRHLVEVADRRVRVVDADGRGPAGPVLAHPQPVGFATLLGDGRTLVVTSGRQLFRYHWRDGRRLGPPIDLPASPRKLAASADGRRIAVSWLEYERDHLKEPVQVFDPASGQPLAAAARLPGPLTGIGFDPGARWLSVWRGARLQLFDATTLAPRFAARAFVAQALPGQPDAGRFDIGLSPAAGAGKAESPDSAGTTSVTIVELAPGERALVVGLSIDSTYGDHGAMCRVRAEDGALLGCASGIVPRVAADRSGETVASVNSLIVRANGHTVSYGEGEHEGGIVAFSHDGRLLARSTAQGVTVFEADSGRQLSPLLGAALRADDAIAQFAFSDDGNRLLARSLLGHWLVWDLAPDQRAAPAILAEAALLARPVLQQPLDKGLARALESADPGPPRPVPALRPNAARLIAAKPVMARSNEAPPWALDLTDDYQFPLGEVYTDDLYTYSGFASLPQGLHRLLGVDYDVRGALLPTQQPGRRIALPAPAAHFPAAHVLATALGVIQSAAPQPYLDAIVHYRDGSSATTRFLYPGHLQKTWRDDGDPLGSPGPPWVAWATPTLLDNYAGRRPRALFALRLDNPHPEREAASLEFRATPVLWSRPVVLAVTLAPVAGAAVAQGSD